MPCTYTIDGKTYSAWEFDDYLRSMPVSEAVKYMPKVLSSQGAATELERVRGGRMSPDRLTIEVGGVERSTTNSNGKPIAQTEEGLRNFWRWFGDSKVVDDQGRPLVVYHGTAADIADFDPAVGSTPGSWFAVHPDGASRFGNRVMPVYLSINRPGTLTDLAAARRKSAQQLDPVEQSREFNAAVLAAVRTAGFDGVRSDNFGGAGGASVWMATSPTQIKSATGNRGTFDPANPDIRYSPARDQTDTPEFKAWSKGLPVFENAAEATSDRGVFKLYHATTADFSTFIPGGLNQKDSGPAIWLSPYKDHQAAYFRTGGRGRFKEGANVMPLFVRIERPMVIDSKDMLAWAQDVFADGSREFPQIFSAATADAIKSEGYDSIVFKGESVGWGENSSEFVVFDPTQIKSATGNRGTFDPTNPDIRYSLSRVPDAIVANPLGAASSDPDHDKAKSGDPVPAMRLALKLVTPELIGQLRGIDRPIVLGVVSVEATGRNKLPAAAANLMAGVLGGQVDTTIFQSNTPKRTQMDGLDRVFSRPTFSGGVEAGRNYILVDDTITQGGTLASLANHIESGGGNVAAVVALTGKQYSRIISPTEQTLVKLRATHGDLENEFRNATGYGFDGLTESEARYLASYKPATAVRDRITSLGAQARPEDVGRDVEWPGSDAPEGRVNLSPNRNLAGMPVPQAWNESMLPDAKARREQFIYEVQDKLVDLKRARDAIKESGIAIRDEFDAYLVEETFHGSAAYQVQLGMEQEFEPLLEEMKMRGIKLEDFDKYLHARHAEERNREMAKRNPNQTELDQQISDLADEVFRETDPKMAAKLETRLRRLRGIRAFSGTEAERNSLSGMSNADAKAFLSGLGNRRAAYDALGAKVDAIVAENRRLMQAYGLETAETVRALGNTYQHYVPLMREMDESDLLGTGSSGTGAGYSVRGSTLKEATGSQRKVEPILANLVAQREQIVVRGEKAKVGRALYGMALSAPNPEFWSVLVPGKMTETQIRQALVDANIDHTLVENMTTSPVEQYVDDPTGLVAWRVNPLLYRDPNAFVLRINGEDRVILFNSRNDRATRMVQALKNEDIGSAKGPIASAINSVFGATTRWISTWNTQYNPIFGMKNFIRDVQSAMLNVATTEISDRKRAMLKGLGPALRAIWRQERGKTATNPQWAQLWDQFRADGGMTGYRDQFNGLESRVKAINRHLNGNKLLDKTGFGYVFKALSDYNTAIESGIRLVAYKEALDKGMSRPRAASLAKNLTVNFNRKGRSGTMASRYYAFFNAAVQGNARIIETMRGGHKGKAAIHYASKFMGAGISLGFAYTMIALAFMGDDWEDIPEFIRERELIIPLGDMDVEGANVGTTPAGYKYLRIPLALGFHAIPNLGRNLAEIMWFRDRVGERAAGGITTFLEAMNPLGGGFSLDKGLAGLGELVMPSVVDPFIQLIANQNAFGRPIAKQNFSERDPTPAPDRFFKSASSLGKMISLALDRISGGDGIDPGDIQITPDQADFVIGQVTGGVGRESLKLYQYLESKVTGEKIPESRVPIVGMFYGETKSEQAVTGKFYELEKRINIAENQLKARNSPEARQALLDEKPEARIVSDMKSAQTRLRRLEKALKKADSRGDDEEVKRLDATILSVRRNLIDLYEEERNRDR